MGRLFQTGPPCATARGAIRSAALHLRDDDRRAAGRHHQHAVAGAEHLVVEIDADDRVRTQLARMLLHLLERDFPCTLQLTLVRGGPSADEIADAGERFLEQVRAQERFDGDYAAALRDASAVAATTGENQ